MKTTQEEFELEFERLKKETHESFTKLFKQYVNVGSWKINFEYNWGINCYSSIDKENNGWYDKLIKEAGENSQ